MPKVKEGEKMSEEGGEGDKSSNDKEVVIPTKKSERIAARVAEGKTVTFAPVNNMESELDLAEKSDPKYLTKLTAVDSLSLSETSEEEEIFLNKYNGAGIKTAKFNDIKPSALIQTFGGDPDEAKHFVNTFCSIANESNWSESFKRLVFESKLTERARKVYSRGLGLNNHMTMASRVKAFLNVFSPPTDTESERERFDNCFQEKGESVSAYSVRLDALAKPMRKMITSPAALDRTLAHQFKKGIKEELKADLYKSPVRGYEGICKLAIYLEQAMSKLSFRRPSRVNNITSEATANEYQRSDHYKKEQPGPSEEEIVYFCTYCRVPGHSNRECRSKGKPPIICFNCREPGHTSARCAKPIHNRVIPTCTNCDRKGHLRANCFILQAEENKSRAKTKVKVQENS